LVESARVRRARETTGKATAAMNAAVQRVPPVYAALYRMLRRRRTTAARHFMEIGGIHPESREAILRDYAYACTRTHRGVTQVLNLEDVVNDLLARGVEGAVVECGTFTGGALAYALRTLVRHGDTRRDVWGFDSFEGMPNPTPEDGDRGALWIWGRRLDELPSDLISGRLSGTRVNVATYEQCLGLLEGTCYPPERIHLVKGWFQEALPGAVPEIGPIALLRLDGDLYESTKVCLETLFDSVVSGGIVIVDDYGTFDGCRRAVDEFLAQRRLAPHLVYVDLGIRYFVK
jgi:O-methyltransferase